MLFFWSTENVWVFGFKNTISRINLSSCLLFTAQTLGTTTLVCLLSHTVTWLATGKPALVLFYYFQLTRQSFLLPIIETLPNCAGNEIIARAADSTLRSIRSLEKTGICLDPLLCSQHTCIWDCAIADLLTSNARSFCNVHLSSMPLLA